MSQVCVKSVQKTNSSTGDHCLWYLPAKQRKSKTDIPTKFLDDFLPLQWTPIITYIFFLHLKAFHRQIWLHAELSVGKSSSSSPPVQVLLHPRRLYRNTGPLTFLCCLLCPLCCLSPVPTGVRPLTAFRQTWALPTARAESVSERHGSVPCWFRDPIIKWKWWQWKTHSSKSYSGSKKSKKKKKI